MKIKSRRPFMLGEAYLRWMLIRNELTSVERQLENPGDPDWRARAGRAAEIKAGQLQELEKLLVDTGHGFRNPFVLLTELVGLASELLDELEPSEVLPHEARLVEQAKALVRSIVYEQAEPLMPAVLSGTDLHKEYR